MRDIYTNIIIEDDFNGCISIKKNCTTIFESAYGYSDLANKLANTIDTKFATASAGKVFIAVAILQLVERGKLNLNDTIGKLLNFNLHDIDPDITIKQLLTHKSGIPDYFDESVMDNYEELWIDYPNYKIRTSEDLLPLFITKPMMYTKGERFQYNNTGFVVLGLIIEAITKKPFDQYLKGNIFDVIGMKSTGYYELDRLPAKCANNYIFDEDTKEYYTNIFSVEVKGTGAGGAFTTIGDIECFWNALLSNKLLSPDMTEKMLSVQSSCEHDDNYGYGIWLNKNSKNNSLPYFTGCDPGVSFISTYKLDENILITIVSNFGDDVWKIMSDIQSQLFGIN
ncbi:beta-lactamase family protein [Clostridium sardiniense]|uniref:Beta-lactamase family protein n=1 Tax=Clostridium sardiniense TaxID=29369 RepID=A0ABS7KX13_CLOSR|nr:serine hydrolase [Clostridium sardiniense]MBY0755354.1 beta-lactamase family protein [Clostridium sardiniense]MDQ0459800.1 CubicO group peptidase (beta-lactamase class C family) [Clostridium sardiniense]